MAETIDTVLGIGSAVFNVLGYVFYRLYKNQQETARQVRNIPIWHPDSVLQDHLTMQDDHTLAYAAVEGVVKDLGRVLKSHHGRGEGVILQSEIIEHKSKRVNGFWSDMKKTIRDNIQYVPFAIVQRDGGDARFKIEITDPTYATHLRDELDVTYEHFAPHKSSIMQIGIDRLFGEVTKGIQETERMLLTGTTVLGVGKVFLEQGQLKIGPPDDSKQTYILTKMRLSELTRQFESQSSTYKFVSAVFALVGGSMLTYLIWRHAKTWLDKRRQRREFEEIRRALEIERTSRGNRESATILSSEDVGSESNTREVFRDDTCVICLSNARQVITLNCGHIAMCAECAEALPLPKKCPVCRQSVEKFLPVYRP